jgi:hypothetical protein
MFIESVRMCLWTVTQTSDSTRRCLFSFASADSTRTCLFDAIGQGDSTRRAKFMVLSPVYNLVFMPGGTP